MSSGLSMASVNKIKELASQREYSLALDIIESQDLSKSLNPQFLRLCGEIYIKNNKLKKARRTLLMSRNLAPESKRVIMLLMDLYYRIGYPELAERYYEIYLFEAGQDGADTKLADYLHEKATGNDLETLSEILGSTYAHTMDYEWSYELFLIYVLRDKKNRAEEIAELYEATFKNSANAELMRAILEGSEDAEEHFRVYATETSEDDSPSEEDLRKIEAKLFEADDLRQHPVEAEITEEVDSLYEQISKRQMKKLLREQARREARAESESDASAEDGEGERVLEEVSEETEKKGLFSKVFGRRKKIEDDDVLEVTESDNASEKNAEAAPQASESDHQEAPETEPEETSEVSEEADTEATERTEETTSESDDPEDITESDPDPDWVNSVPDAVVIEDETIEEKVEEVSEAPEAEASNTDTAEDTDEPFVPAHPPRSSAIVESVELEDIESDTDEEFDDFGDWDEDDEFGDIEESAGEAFETAEPDETSESITEDVEASVTEPSESDYEAWEEDEPKEDFTDESEPWIEDDIPEASEEPEAEAEPEEEAEFEEEAEPEEIFEPESEPEVAPQFEYEAPESDPDYVYEGELIEDEPETAEEYEEEPEPETVEEYEEEPEPETVEEYEEEPEPETVEEFEEEPEPETVEEYEEEPEPETVEEYEEEPEPETVEEYEEEPEPETAEEYEAEPEPETAEEYEEEPEPETVEEFEEEPEPAYDPNTFNISYKKKKLDYPVFRSSLFPNYHKEYKDVENHFGDIVEKSNETLNENLEKERRLQQEAEELLKSLGIEIDGGKKVTPAQTVPKQAPMQEVKPETKPEPRQEQKPAERVRHEENTAKRDRTALKNSLKVSREMRETLRKLKDNR